MEFKKYTLSLLLILTMTAAMAQKSEIFSTEEGAIQGYDPVAFFKESKPVLGKKEFTYSWNGASWYFSTRENLDTFRSDPGRYAPQYGGWCAYGTAEGHKSPTQPETWSIVDNKLYFNYNPEVKKLWTKNQKDLIDQANRNWPKVKLK